MWHNFKLLLKDNLGHNDAVLHLVFGLILYAVLALLLKRPLFAFLGLAAVQVINEVIDLYEDRSGSGISGSIEDCVWTLGLPLLVSAMWLAGRRRSRPS